MVAAALIAWRGRPRTEGDLALQAAILNIVAFMLAKQAFFNYYFASEVMLLAAMAGAGGVHVGQEDLPVDEARKICGAPLWVGVSTHTLEQLRAAEATSADYIAVGPIFPTGTKANPDPVVGLEFLRAARQITRKPLVAIGGITVESAGEVYRAGADSIAVIRDLMAARDPAHRAREYLAIARRVRPARPADH